MYEKTKSWVTGSKQIGRGGHARVFEAVLHNQKVAIKFIPLKEDNFTDIIGRTCTSQMYGCNEYCKHVIASQKFPTLVDRPIGFFFGFTNTTSSSENSENEQIENVRQSTTDSFLQLENSGHTTEKTHVGFFIVMKLWPKTLRDIMGSWIASNTNIMDQVLSNIRDIVVAEDCSHGDIKLGSRKYLNGNTVGI